LTGPSIIDKNSSDAKNMSLVENNPFEKIIVQENLEGFAPQYTPENFTEEEIKYLKPFFTNVDQPVFVVQNLPEEVTAALSAKYSRATETMRRTFLNEYVDPIIHPENQKKWNELTKEEKADELDKKRSFKIYIDGFMGNGGIEKVVDKQRGQKFFDKWLVEYGDDSISEMGNVHVCIEGLSIIATKEIEDQRIGISPIEKSTRYVSFADKLPDGNYRYIVPGEIRGTDYEKTFRSSMDILFSTYSMLLEPYAEYIKGLYPKGDDETDASFEKSRRAKTFDDLRDLLPFSTITNLGLSGNGRAYEYLVNRMANHPLGEMRYWAFKIASEVHKVTPSFIRRLESPSGRQIQEYKREIKELRNEFSNQLFEKQHQHRKVIGARLLEYTMGGEESVLSAYIFTGNNSPSLHEVKEKVRSMSDDEKTEIFNKISMLRKQKNPDAKREDVRFKKIPRAFENSHYTYEFWARGGDYRDLQRHRMLTQERQNFTTIWGFDLEKEVLDSPFVGKIEKALSLLALVYEHLTEEHADAAQYVVPFAYIQHWYTDLTAREMYYMAELRTGPQGRPHYRKIVQEMARQAIEIHPRLFAGMMVDWNDYSLARRESEKWTEAKKKELNI